MTRMYLNPHAPRLMKVHAAFPLPVQHMNPAIYSNPQRHAILCDPTISPRCGFATHDEAAVLHQCAQRSPGRWLEIGTHLGWTAAHIASAPEVTELVCLEPELRRVSFNLTGSPDEFRRRLAEHLDAAGVGDKTTLHGDASQEYLSLSDKPTPPESEKFSGVFIDGEHEPPFPKNDARLVFPFLRETCVVIFHDALGSPVQDGVRELLSLGHSLFAPFKWRLYKTPQLLAVCWRGNFDPPPHEPDSSFAWNEWLASINFDRRLLESQS